MAQQYDPFSDYMQTGESDLHEGNLINAYNSFERALDESIDNEEKAVAQQHLGIVCRLMGKFDEARQHFQAALSHADGNHLLTASIQNDFAINYMELADITLHGPIRNSLFARADNLLIQARDTFVVSQMPNCAAVSEGFLARLQLFRGRRKDAQYSFADVDRKLQSGNNRNHELDNLMWYISIAEAKARPQLAERALDLIYKTGQRRRLTQLRLVQLGINPVTLLHAKRFVKRIIRK